jgi:hypothetical protein
MTLIQDYQGGGKRLGMHVRLLNGLENVAGEI